MVLESLSPGASVNVHDLVIEKPEARIRSPFDQIVNLSDDDWQKASELLGRTYSTQEGLSLMQFTQLASSMLILFPERRNELSFDSENKKVLTASMEWLQEYAYLKILFPENPTEFIAGNKIKSLERTREKIINVLEGDRSVDLNDPQNKSILMQIMLDAADLKLLFPRAMANVRINPKNMPDFVWMLEDTRAIAGGAYSILSRAKIILTPEEFRENVPLTKEDWDKMETHLPDKHQFLEDYFRIAAYFKILASEEIKITESTFELIMPNQPQDFRSQPPPLPETRRF